MQPLPKLVKTNITLSGDGESIKEMVAEFLVFEAFFD